MYAHTEMELDFRLNTPPVSSRCMFRKPDQDRWSKSEPNALAQMTYPGERNVDFTMETNLQVYHGPTVANELHHGKKKQIQKYNGPAIANELHHGNKAALDLTRFSSRLSKKRKKKGCEQRKEK